MAMAQHRSNTIQQIVEDKVDVRSFYAWSILDNFEWSDGYLPRFGLTYVDYDAGQARTPKNSSSWFASLAEARRAAAASRDTEGLSSIAGEAEKLEPYKVVWLMFLAASMVITVGCFVRNSRRPMKPGYDRVVQGI